MLPSSLESTPGFSPSTCTNLFNSDSLSTSGTSPIGSIDLSHSSLSFLQILPTVAFLFFFGTDYGLPGLFPILLSISVLLTLPIFFCCLNNCCRLFWTLYNFALPFYLRCHFSSPNFPVVQFSAAHFSGCRFFRGLFRFRYFKQ